MKGVSYITNDKKQKTAVIIDLKTLNKFDKNPEDLFDCIISEVRSHEPTVSWEMVKSGLKKKAKL
jgi:hypothetical protein